MQHSDHGGPEVILVKPISNGVKPLCDSCNRNNYPCRCPRANQEIIIACEDFILSHGVHAPAKSRTAVAADKTEPQADW
jgi:hypothetical protein